MRRNAVQAAAVVADHLARDLALFQTHHVERLSAQRVFRTEHEVDGLFGHNALSFEHAAVGEHLIVSRHIRRRGFDAGAAPERRQDGPAVVFDQFAVVVFLEQPRHVAVAYHGLQFAAVLIQDGAGHAQGLKDALHQELFQGDAGRLVHDVGQDGVRLVAVTHIFARFAQGLVTPFRDVIRDLFDRIHRVGAFFSQSFLICGFAAGSIDGDGPFQRLHGRDACPVQPQLPYGDQLVRHAGKMQGREVFRDRILQAHPALGGQHAAGQRRERFAHGRDAEHRVRGHVQILFDAPFAEALLIDDALRPADADRYARQFHLFDALLQRFFQCGNISLHSIHLNSIF